MICAPLVLMGSFVPMAVCSGWVGPQRNHDKDMWRTLRRVTDELGYNLAQQYEVLPHPLLCP